MQIRSATPSALILSGMLLFAAAAPTWATPNHAHYFYMVSVRALTGSMHATMLYHEASAEGLNLELARENAREMSRLAAEINEWTIKLGGAQSKKEAAALKSDLLRILQKAAGVEQQSRELGKQIDDVRHSGEALAPETKEWIANQSRTLFIGFQEILGMQKMIEDRLGIPVPAEPPVD